MPTDPAALQALAARLEAATEGGRELDQDIAVALFGWVLWQSKYGHWELASPHGKRASSFDWPRQPKFDPDTGEPNPLYGVPPLLADEAGLPYWTASLDAAVALVDAVFPRWQFWVRRNTSPSAHAWIWDGYSEAVAPTFYAPTPALALCRAIVEAKLATAIYEEARDRLAKTPSFIDTIPPETLRQIVEDDGPENIGTWPG